MIFSAASIVVAFRLRHLGLRDVANLGGGDAADLVLCGSALPLSTPAAFLICSSGAGGVFVMKVNVPVFVDRDLDRDDVASPASVAALYWSDEVHDVHAVRAQRGADGRRRGGLGRQAAAP